MTIAYVGNFSQRHCTEVHLAATLEKLGHQVVRLQENEVKQDTLAAMIPSNSWDLFLFTRTWGDLVTMQHLAQLREAGIPSASYHLDLYIGLTRKWQFGGKTIGEMLQSDPFWRTDFVFTPDGDPGSAEVFEANGINHHYIRPGVFEGECYIAKREKDLPVVFVGGGAAPGDPDGYGHPEWPYRNELIGWLRENYGDRFHKFGHPQETIRNESLNQLYADADIVVGDSVCLNFSHENYWSDRVYETLGRGGFLIHPQIKGLGDEFSDGVHLRFYEYGNWKQLKHYIDYYLDNPKEREIIRQRGHDFVKANCTYTQRLSQMLEIMAGPESQNKTAVRKKTPSKKTPVKKVGPAIKISLGAGTEIEPKGDGWVNVDLLALEGIDVVHNLMEFPYPFANNSAEFIKAKDLIEHLDHYTKDGQPSVVSFVEECYRILEPGGKLWIQTPGWDAEFLWIDPTHVRGFDVRTMDFFDPETDFGRSGGFISKAQFKVKATKSENNNLIFEMEKR